MIVNNSLDEVKKRENALSIIKNIIETKGRNELYDLTGYLEDLLLHHLN